MAKYIERVKVEYLGRAVRKALEEYTADVVKQVNVESEKTAQELVEITKATAPVGVRKRHYRSFITYSEKVGAPGKFAGKTYVWHVKSPEYRLTHLLVHGHATANGGRTRPNPFLHNAIDRVAPDYQKRLVEAIKNGK